MLELPRGIWNSATSNSRRRTVMKYIEPIELDMAYRAYNEREDVKLAISLYETAAKKIALKQ